MIIFTISQNKKWVDYDSLWKYKNPIEIAQLLQRSFHKIVIFSYSFDYFVHKSCWSLLKVLLFILNTKNLHFWLRSHVHIHGSVNFGTHSSCEHPDWWFDLRFICAVKKWHLGRVLWRAWMAISKARRVKTSVSTPSSSPASATWVRGASTSCLFLPARVFGLGRVRPSKIDNTRFGAA